MSKNVLITGSSNGIGAAAAIALAGDCEAIPADGQSIAQIEVSLLDANGNFAAADEEITYQVMGDAQIIGIENGKPDDLTPYASHSRDTFRGKAIVYLRAGTLKGDVLLGCFTRSGLSARLNLTQN